MWRETQSDAMREVVDRQRVGIACIRGGRARLSRTRESRMGQVVEPAKASTAATSEVTETGKVDSEPKGKKNEALRKNEIEKKIKMDRQPERGYRYLTRRRRPEWAFGFDSGGQRATCGGGDGLQVVLVEPQAPQWREGLGWWVVNRWGTVARWVGWRDARQNDAQGRGSY